MPGHKPLVAATEEADKVNIVVGCGWHAHAALRHKDRASGMLCGWQKPVGGWEVGGHGMGKAQ